MARRKPATESLLGTGDVIPNETTLMTTPASQALPGGVANLLKSSNMGLRGSGPFTEEELKKGYKLLAGKDHKKEK